MTNFLLIQIIICMKYGVKYLKINVAAHRRHVTFLLMKLFIVLEITPSIKPLRVKEINLFSDVFPRGEMYRLAIFESLQSCNSNGVFITIR